MQLRIEVDGDVTTVDPPRVVRIGRAADADLRLLGDAVSRAHAELRSTPDGWLLVDVGSQHGLFVDDQRITELPLTGPTTIRCGPPGDGTTFVVTPVAAPTPQPAPAHEGWPQGGGGRPVPAPGAAPVTPSDGFAETVVLAAPLAGPMPGMQVQRTGPDLMIVAEGEELRFRHPANITIGRHPDSTVVISDPVCSRQHGRVDAVGNGWVFTNGSQEGTFLDGRRIHSEHLTSRMSLRLGHPVAGPELELVPILTAKEEERRAARARTGRRVKVVGAAAAALMLVTVVVLAVVLNRDDETPVAGGNGGEETDSLAVLTAEERDVAKVAAVLIAAETTTPTGEVASYSGSGSVITEGGLILTNAHVGEPEADGLAEQYGPTEVLNPDFLLIGILEEPDARADFQFRARPVVTDGVMDISVLQIYADADGTEIDPADLDLPVVPLGDSDDLSSGDPITVLGFPGIASLGGNNIPEVTVTNGVISTFLDTERLGERSEIDTAARIAPGNSGGMAINNDGEIIGVPSAFAQADESTPIVSGRIRPINIAQSVIDEAEGQ
ncbi:MAG: FHA domain-containing protein [Nocardioides sp.]